MSNYNPVNVEDLHDDTFNTVVRAADDVLVKLRHAQLKHGLTRGWRYPPPNAAIGEGRLLLGIDPKYTMEFEGILHHALHDCRHQFKTASTIVRELLAAIKEKCDV